MGVKTKARTYTTGKDDPYEVKRSTAGTEPQAEYDPLEMTQDRLSWLFDEEATRLVEDARKGRMGFHGDEDFVVGEDILESLGSDWEETIQNLQERFAADLVDGGFDPAEAVEIAEDRIDSDEFLWAHEDALREKLLHGADASDIRYFDTWADAIATTRGFSESEVNDLLKDPSPYEIASFVAANRRGAILEVLDALPMDALDGGLHDAFVKLMAEPVDEHDLHQGYSAACWSRGTDPNDRDFESLREELLSEENRSFAARLAHERFSRTADGISDDIGLRYHDDFRVYDGADEVENGTVRVEIDDDPRGTKADRLIEAMEQRGYASSSRQSVDNSETTDSIVAFRVAELAGIEERLLEEAELQAQIDAEEDFERRAAFGEGATVVNVLTGKTRPVGGQREPVDLMELLAEASAKVKDTPIDTFTAQANGGRYNGRELPARRSWDKETRAFYKKWGQFVVVGTDFDPDLARKDFPEWMEAYENEANNLLETTGNYEMLDDVDLEAVAYHLWKTARGGAR